MKLSEDLKKWRAERPDEWTMDRFIEKATELEARCDELADFCIWLTGCGYDFCQHDYFNKQRDKLLKNAPPPKQGRRSDEILEISEICFET